jgi:hypothetical protein
MVQAGILNASCAEMAPKENLIPQALPQQR